MKKHCPKETDIWGLFKSKHSPHLPDGMTRAEYDSRRWHLMCSVCGNKKSYFDLGATRTRAMGTGKSRRIQCTVCGQKQRFNTVWIDSETETPETGPKA